MGPEWYDIVAGDELAQGDIIPACPVFNVTNLDLPEAAVAGSEVNVDGEVLEFDLIVLSQTCDLVVGQGQQKLKHVVLCNVASISKVWATDGHSLSTTNLMREAASGKQPAFFVLEAFAGQEGGPPPREIGVVHFQQVYTLPIEFVRKVASQRGPRLRLRSPNREYLSQRFGMFFARVAIDQHVDTPPRPKPDRKTGG